MEFATAVRSLYDKPVRTDRLALPISAVQVGLEWGENVGKAETDSAANPQVAETPGSAACGAILVFGWPIVGASLWCFASARIRP